MLVGIISDTHSYMDPRAISLLQGVDHILHAGDIGSIDIIQELRNIAPVTLVRGYVDLGGPTSLFPAEETLELEGHRIFLTHELKPPKSDADPSLALYQKAGIQVVVYGHSHIAYQRRWSNILFFNPGAAGKRRFKVVPSIGFITLTESDVRASITSL